MTGYTSIGDCNSSIGEKKCKFVNKKVCVYTFTFRCFCNNKSTQTDNNHSLCCPKRVHRLHSVPRVCLSLFVFYPLFFFPLLFFPSGFFRLPCGWNRRWAGLADVKRRSLTEQEKAKYLHRCNLFIKQEEKNSDPRYQNLRQVLQNEGSKQQQQHLLKGPNHIHCLHSVPHVCLSLFLFYPLFFFPLLFFPLGFFRLPCGWNRWWAGLADVKRRSLTEQEEAKNLHRCNLFSKQEGKNSDPRYQNLKQVLQTKAPNSNNNICFKDRTIFTAYTVSHMFASLCSCSIFSILSLSFFSASSAYDTVEIYGEQDWLMRIHHWLKRRIPSVSTESREMQKQTLLKRPSAIPLFMSKSKALLNLNFLIGTGNTASELLKSRSMLITHIGLQPNQTLILTITFWKEYHLPRWGPLPLAVWVSSLWLFLLFPSPLWPFGVLF